MALVLSQPSPFRKQLLKIAKMLSREDVDELVFLAEDFISQSEQKQISSGVDLMRCLIRHGRLEPGNCYYLYFCLNEIGRVDLARSLSEFYLLPPLPATPPSFSAPSQMVGIKLKIVRSKQAQYKEQVSYFMQSEAHWISEYRELLQGLTADVNSPPDSSTVQKVLGNTLQHISTILDAQTTAITYFESTKQYSQISTYIHEANTAYEKLQSTLLGCIRWKSQQHWQVLNLPNIACSLADFLSELLEKPIVTTELSMILNTSEVVGYLPRNVLGILHWLFVATEVVVSFSLDIQSCAAQLTAMLTQLLMKGHIHHHEIITSILKGTKILEKAQKDILLITTKEKPSTGPVSIPQSCPLLLGIFICLLVLRYSTEATLEDWKQIKANFTLNEKAFGNMLHHATEKIYRELRSGTDCLLQMALKEVHVPVLQEVITELLSL